MTKQACIKIDIKKNSLKETLDLESVAAYLSGGWQRYVELFGEPPHGTIKQFLALLELSHVDFWQTMRGRSKGRRPE